MKKILLVVPYPIEVSGTLMLVTPLCKSLRQSGYDAHEFCVGQDVNPCARPGQKCNHWERPFATPAELMKTIEDCGNDFDSVFFAGVFHDAELRARQIAWCTDQKQSSRTNIGLLWERTGADFVIPEDHLFLNMIQDGIDRLFVLNEQQRISLAERGVAPSSIADLHPGVDTKLTFKVPQPEQRMAIRRQYGWAQAKSVFLVLSRFVERKRVEFIMETWLNSPVLWDDSKLVVVGSGFGSDKSTEPLVEELASRHPSIELIKYRQGMDPIAFYHAADAYVTASCFEGEPRSVIEAMACGLPIVASQIPGHNDLVKHGKTGLLFGLENRCELTKHLHSIQNDDAQRRFMSEQARIEIVETRDLSIIAHQLVENLESTYCDGSNDFSNTINLPVDLPTLSDVPVTS